MDRCPVQAEVRFRNQDVLTQHDGLSAADFRLAEDSPGKGAGADVDLVGPGAVYEKWKTTREYNEWLKQSQELRKSPVQ